MIYTVIYYDEENNIRSFKQFSDLDKAKQFNKEHIYSDIFVCLTDYKDLRKELDIKKTFLKDIKNMIERNI